jgi:hypothetical protein
VLIQAKASINSKQSLLNDVSFLRCFFLWLIPLQVLYTAPNLNNYEGYWPLMDIILKWISHNAMIDRQAAQVRVGG